MEKLDQIIRTEVLPVINAGLVECESYLFSLIIPTRKYDQTKKQFENYWIEYGDQDEKRCEPAYLNDHSDLWVAFILNQVNYEVLQEKGKKKIYLATATVDVVGYSKVFRKAGDYVVSRLSELPFITIVSFNQDSYRILERISNVKEYNFKHDLFEVKIDIKFKIDFCDNKTLTGVEACG